MIVNVSSTYLFQSTRGDGDVMLAWTSKSSMNRFATMGLMGDPIGSPFCLLIIPAFVLEMGVLKTKFQETADVVDCHVGSLV